jgi:hypothetical protein
MRFSKSRRKRRYTSTITNGISGFRQVCQNNLRHLLHPI